VPGMPWFISIPRLFALTLLAAQGPGPTLILANEAGDSAAASQPLPPDDLLPPEDADEEACRATGGDACALSLRQLRAQPVAELQAAKTGHGPYAHWESDGRRVTVYRIQKWPVKDRDEKGVDQLTLTEANGFTAACASGMTAYGNSDTALILKFEVDFLKMSPHHYCECNFEHRTHRECRYHGIFDDCKNMGYTSAMSIDHCEWYSFPKKSQCEGSDPTHLTDPHQQWGKLIWGERTKKKNPCDWMSASATAKKKWHCVREKMKGPDGRATAHSFEAVMNDPSECLP